MSLNHDDLKNLFRNSSELSGGHKVIARFKKNRWVAGSDGVEIPSGTKLVVDPTQAQRGYVRWEDRKPVERKMLTMASPERLSSREELGHADAEVWPIGRDGKPSDPWQKTFEIPAREIDGEQRDVLITGSSVGFGRAFGIFFKAVCNQIGANPGKKPMVELSAGTFKHKLYDLVDCPVLNLVGWMDQDLEGGDEEFAEDPSDDVPF